MWTDIVVVVVDSSFLVFFVSLFVYGLFRGPVSRLNFKWRRIGRLLMNMECGKRWKQNWWHCLRYRPDICVNEPRNTTETLVRRDSNSVLPNMKQGCQPVSRLFVININIIIIVVKWPRQLNRYTDSVRAGRSGNRIPMKARSPRPTRPALGPTPPPIKWIPGLFPGDKAAGVLRWPPTSSSTEVKEKVELCLYSLSAPSWLIRRLTLAFYYHYWILSCLSSKFDHLFYL